MTCLCGQSSRREQVLATPCLNGIDYVEVLGPPGCGTELAITFLKPATGLALVPANVVLSGDDPVTVTATGIMTTAQDPATVTVALDATGGFAPYTLRLAAATVAADGTVTVYPDPPDGLDPVLSCVTFSFKAGCPSPADCLPAAQAPAPGPTPPDINYLARDYDGFRQVLLDRLAVVTPAWTERHAADLGIVLAEILAYAADHLSYAQDAVGTEAYLRTARSRISVRRLAWLLDYQIGEGCAARALVALTTQADDLTVPAGTYFYPARPGLPVAAQSGDPAAALLAGTGPAFYSLTDLAVATEQNAISFYSWGDDDYCLPAGATSATFKDQLTSLAAGTLLIFEEVLGPGTGVAGDADPAHRCAVLLTSVRYSDYRDRPLADPVGGTLVTEVTWADADALPFPLVVTATIDGNPLAGVSLARGNIVPAENGTQITGEQLAPVPATGRYYPQLASSPLSFRAPIAPSPAGTTWSASSWTTTDAADATPVISLTDSESPPRTWTPQSDLLSSGPADTCFVPEVEGDGTAWLRFGDGEHGLQPNSTLTFTASYQTGNGSAGNIGQDVLGQAVFIAPSPPALPFPAQRISGVRNPLPVTSGVDPESIDHVRKVAPFSIQQQKRCVTEDDYGTQAAALPDVSQARGTLRWTGSWYTAFVSVDPATADVSGPMDQLRMLGTDVAAEGAVIVGLRIALAVCVDAEHFQGDVYTALMARFTGPGGLLAAANFTFGQTVYASPLIAAAQAIEGVASVTLATFSRLDQPWVDGTTTMFLTLGRLEIPHCDNDPDHLDHGLFTIELDGGKLCVTAPATAPARPPPRRRPRRSPTRPRSGRCPTGWGGTRRSCRACSRPCPGRATRPWPRWRRCEPATRLTSRSRCSTPGR